MKAVDVRFSKIDIVDYYPQHDQVKVRIVYDDGTEKAYIKQVSITDADSHIRAWLADIRQQIKDTHQDISLDDHPLANALIIRYNEEPDVLRDRMTRFLQLVSQAIRTGKLSNLSYYDMEQKLTRMSQKL